MNTTTNRAGIYQVLMALEWGSWPHRLDSQQPRPNTVPACQLIRPQESYQGKQALTYQRGISAESVGANSICMHLLTIPPGGRAKAHYHEKHETAIYMISGESAMWYGEGLAQHMTAQAGDLIYIPAGVPHLPYNPGQEPCCAVIARTDPKEQESVVLLPALDGLPR